MGKIPRTTVIGDNASMQCLNASRTSNSAGMPGPSVKFPDHMERCSDSIGQSSVTNSESIPGKDATIPFGEPHDSNRSNVFGR
jgi:hypothetical protein